MPDNPLRLGALAVEQVKAHIDGNLSPATAREERIAATVPE
jgi:hypothetical protein